MADVAVKQIKQDGKWIQPGQELKGLSKEDKEYLKKEGAIAEKISDDDVAKVKAYEAKVAAATEEVETAKAELDKLEGAVSAAKGEKEVKQAEAEVDKQKKVLKAAEDRLKAIS